MPRIRQEEKIPRIRQPNGNPNLPDTGPVIVELGAEPQEQLVYGKPSATHAEPSMREADVVTVDEPRPQPVPRTVAPQYEQETEDDAVASLRASEKRAKDRAKAAETSAAQTLQWGQQQAAEAAQAKHAVTESQLDTVSSALAAAEADVAAAEQAYAEAWQKGDGLGVAKATRAMGDAQYRINTLRAGKDELETQVKQKPQVAAPPAAAAGIEAVLARLPNLMDAEKNWIREHPESLATQENVNRLQVAYSDANARGLKRGSPEYFAFFNERLGYDEEPGTEDPDGEYEDDPPVRPQRRQTMTQPLTRRVAAPVSRSGNGGQPRLREGQIMLTEEQRKAAKISGVSELEYARGVQRLMQAKQQGIYPMHETK